MIILSVAEEAILQSIQSKEQSVRMLVDSTSLSKSTVYNTLRLLERLKYIETLKDRCQIANKRTTFFKVTKAGKGVLNCKEVA